MLRQIILAVIVAIAVTLVCIFLGVILEAAKLEVATAIGNFLQAYGAVIGILAGLWYFFAGYTRTPR